MPVKIERLWSMPNKHTFSIPPISTLLDEVLVGRRVIVDPFSSSSHRGTICNDLDPSSDAEYHTDAAAFCDELISRGVIADAILFDPPYSPRQISEVYKRVGLAVGMRETQNGRLYKSVRDRLAQLSREGTVAVSCGWNSAGFGQSRGFEVDQILLVAHGGAHNDTIVVVETLKHPECCR